MFSNLILQKLMNDSSKNNWQKPLIVLLIFSLLFGCSEWVLVKKPESQTIKEDKPTKIKVTLNNRDQYILYNPFVKTDTLFGGFYLSKGNVLNSDQQKYIKKDTLSFPYNHTISISVNDIKEVRIEKDYSGILPGLIIVGFLVGGIVYLIHKIANEGFSPYGNSN